jgi:NitT/TauT family transport system substrate-binding protein
MRRFVMVLLMTGAVGCHGSQLGSRPPTVRIAIHRDPIAFLPVRVAQTLGYYEQEGVAVEMSEVAGGTKAMEALLGGSVDVAAGSMSDAVQLAAEGRSVRCFLVLYTRPSLALAVAPALSSMIRTVRDLKGRTVGVSTPGAATHQFLNFLLVSNGLSPADVSVVSVGMSASSVAALEHGKVDAAVLIASAISTFEARQAGNTLLADTRTAAGARQVFGAETFPSLSLISQDRWLQQNDDTARRLVRALKRGMRWVREHPAEQVREMIPEGARTATAEADLRSIRGVQRGMSMDGLVPAGAAERVEKFVALSNSKVEAAHIDVAKTYTNEFASVK